MPLSHYRITYAQNREDLLLAGMLRKIDVGFYVDVGANHPEFDSVTKLFYDKGWCGINIEPDERLHEELCRQRPRDINIKAGLYSQEGTLRFRSYLSAGGLSTFSSEAKRMYEALHVNSDHQESSVDVLSLAQVLLKHRPSGDVHFLKVDVEGLELEVLLGNAWDRFRPWLLCIERTSFHARREATSAFLGACSYAQVFFDGINDYFVANEKRVLWDEFSYAREMIMGGLPLHRVFVDHINAAPPARAPAPAPAEPVATHVQQLLALDGAAFVHAAYVTILRRAPDAGGMAHYLEKLNRGASKIAIISRLRNSEEGRQHQHHLAGYKVAALGDRLRFPPRKPRREGAAPNPFHSRFGGTWIDRRNFPEELSRRIQSGSVPESLADALREFERRGVVVLRQAASEPELASFEDAISTAFREGHAQLISQYPGESAPRPVTAGMNRSGARIVDSFAVLPQALDLLSTPRLVEFLQILFEERPKLFQSLSFDMGSEQGLHQDTAYVVVDRPMEMVGCWIALEDVRPGSGELRYMTGSHRLPDFDFGGNKKHWDASGDLPGIHDIWSRWLLQEGERLGLSVESFLARRADILVWHADLAHGGAPITTAHSSRKSLVGHYCPESAIPNYAKVTPARAVTRTHRGICYCSWYYDLTRPSAA